MAPQSAHTLRQSSRSRLKSGATSNIPDAVPVDITANLPVDATAGIAETVVRVPAEVNLPGGQRIRLEVTVRVRLHEKKVKRS